MRRHAHVDFQLVSQKSSGILDIYLFRCHLPFSLCHWWCTFYYVYCIALFLGCVLLLAESSTVLEDGSGFLLLELIVMQTAVGFRFAHAAGPQIEHTMDKTGEEAASRFINALIKSVQTLCHGYLDFENGVEIIGHINLSVDRGGSLDYILKEKVCKNAENSTMFISNSFYAEPKPELSVGRSSWQADDRGMHQGESPDLGESDRVSSAISSISSSLSASRARLHRNFGASQSPRSHHKTAKRRASLELSSEVHPAKVSHISTETVFPDNHASEILLPQTANVTDGPSLEVNLAGSVLEPVGNEEGDEDSDDGLEVRFIKEEYGDRERSSCDFDNSTSRQFGGDLQRGTVQSIIQYLPRSGQKGR